MRSYASSRFSSGLLAFLTASMAGCNSGPTARDITDSLDQELSSVVGEWTGTSVDADQGALTLSFRLQAGSGTGVTGTGTMQERGAATPVPVTVSGFYARPVLTLTFEGMQFDGRPAQGAFSGRYTTVGGISDALVLTGTAYSRTIPMLLQER